MSVGSIIIPVLNEEAGIQSALIALQPQRELDWEIIVVDGGSVDNTVALATPYADSVFASEPGRAKQMNVGAGQADGALLVFLHVDTQLPSDFSDQMNNFRCGEYRWGRFDVSLSGKNPMFSVIAWFMNKRSRLTSIATGDQALFFKREHFDALGGYADISLMEDVEICKRSKSLNALPFCSNSTVVTSSRKWEDNGVWKTIWLMWRLRYAYYKGASPSDLHRSYYS